MNIEDKHPDCNAVFNNREEECDSLKRISDRDYQYIKNHVENDHLAEIQYIHQPKHLTQALQQQQYLPQQKHHLIIQQLVKDKTIGS